jgi:hypothetical protein
MIVLDGEIYDRRGNYRLGVCWDQSAPPTVHLVGGFLFGRPAAQNLGGRGARPNDPGERIKVCVDGRVCRQGWMDEEGRSGRDGESGLRWSGNQ